MENSPIHDPTLPANKRLPQLLWWGFFVLCLSLGICLILFALLPYPTIQPLANLLARDGSLEVFDLATHSKLRLPSALAGLFFLSGGLAWLATRKRSHTLTRGLAQSLARYSIREDFSSMWGSFRLALAGRSFVVGLLVVIFLGAGIRWLFVSQPMRYDEAYTVVGFAARPLWNAISDYHLPNNHVFHTLLVHGMVQVFGFQEWAVRLPALLAGVACIPLVYLAGTAIYDRPTGLLAAAWVAFSPLLIDASTNARGYMLVAMFTLLLLLLAAYLLRHASLLAWCLLSITAALGFFTLPTMLYPFALVYTWLAISWVIGDAPSARKPEFIYALLASAAAAGLLSLIFYLPILLVSGPTYLFGNRFIQSLSWQNFFGNLPVRAIDTWASWTEPWSQLLVIIFAAGLFLSIIGHSRFSRYRVHLLVPVILGIGGILFLQRVTPLARIWSFLLPVCFLLASAGLVGGVRIILASQKTRPWQTPVFLVALFLISTSLIWSTSQERPENKDEYYGPVRETEQIARQLAGQVKNGDVIAANSPVQAPLRFYLLGLGISDTSFYNKQDPSSFESALLVIERGSDLENELARVKLHTHLDPATRIPVAESAALIAYRIYPFP